jgi:mannose-6-phosphate isomerase
MTTQAPYPFRTRPYLREKVWGGRRLVDFFSKGTEDDIPLGEAWEVSALQEGQSVVDTGPAAGSSLSEVTELWGGDLVGSRASGDGFPLLVKILDAADDLSVQVHPSQQDIEQHFPDADSKDECWVILASDEGGSILHGVQDGVDAEAFRQAVEEGRAEEVCRRVDVEPGQVVRVVPGTIHAICEGVVLLEIQQPSDTTYRVYDYDRPGLDGEPRELHLDEAMTVANFGEQPPTEVAGQPLDHPDADVDLLIDVPSYRIERLRASNPATWTVDPGSLQVVSVLEGAGVLSWGDGEIDLQPGTTAIIPAVTDRVTLTPRGESVDAVVSGVGGARLVGAP